MDFSSCCFPISVSSATVHPHIYKSAHMIYTAFDLLFDLFEWSPTEAGASEEVVLLNMGLPPVR